MADTNATPLQRIDAAIDAYQSGLMELMALIDKVPDAALRAALWRVEARVTDAAMSIDRAAMQLAKGV